MELSTSKDSPGDTGDAIDREVHPLDEGSSERSSYNEGCNSPLPGSPEDVWMREAEKEMLGAAGSDCESFEGIVNSSLYPTPPPPPAPGTKTLLTTITEVVPMSAIVQEQGAVETPTGAHGKGARRNSKDTMSPNSLPDKGKAIDKRDHWWYDGSGDWSEVRRSRDDPVQLSSIMEHVKSSYINQEYKEGEPGDDGQEFWEQCWATDRVAERPKDQSALRECTWEKLTEDTTRDKPLNISGLQLRMLEFKRRATELDMDDKDYAQAEAIMKEFQTEAMIFQIRVQDLNLRIASNEKAIEPKENLLKELEEDAREGKILLAIRRAIRKKAEDIREALENGLGDIREKLCEDMEKLMSLETAVQAKPDPDEPLLDEELELLKEVGDKNEFEVAMKESQAKLEALSIDITDGRGYAKEKERTVQDDALVVLRTKLLLDGLREDVSAHGVRIRRLVRIIQEADQTIDELRSV